MLTFTLDTNCLYDLDERRPAAPYLDHLLVAHRDGRASVALVAVSASERQRGDRYLDTYTDFLGRVAALVLDDLPILKGMGYLDISYWDHALYADDAMKAREREIHAALFPSFPFDWVDFAASRGISTDDIRGPSARPWRNKFCDRQMFWAHDHAGRDVFVTSDTNFTRLEALPAFTGRRVMSPVVAASLL